MTEAGHADGVAIVTGAAGGMGRECARILVREGWRELILCDLDAEALDSMASELDGARVTTLASDVAARDFADRLAAAIGARLVGALLHAAGVSSGDLSPEQVLAINLDGTIGAVSTVRERMARGGAVVLFASIAGHWPVSPEADAAFEQPIPPEGSKALLHLVPSAYAAYSLSKRALRAMARREAAAFGKRGARIVSISPGLVDTAMTQGERSADLGGILACAALERMGRADELAEVAVFLCSARASYITGCDIVIDGGTLAGMAAAAG